MPAHSLRRMPPSVQDAALARASSQLLSRHATDTQSLMLRMTDAEQVELPASAVASLMDILEAMASGRNVTIVPEDIELTTVQAAEILNVSRPFLIKLLDEGAIPHRRVGKHRRLRVEDVIAYKAAIDGERERVLESLVHLAQTERMGYDG